MVTNDYSERMLQKENLTAWHVLGALPLVVSWLLFRSSNYRSGQGMDWGGTEVKWVRPFGERWLVVRGCKTQALAKHKEQCLAETKGRCLSWLPGLARC